VADVAAGDDPAWVEENPDGGGSARGAVAVGVALTDVAETGVDGVAGLAVVDG
jgi:hypothetical protein